MAVTTADYVTWVQQAGIPAQRRTPELDAVLEAVFRFRQRQGNDYYSTRLLSHFLLHCACGLKVAQIARLVGIARPTASHQQGMSSKAVIQQAHHRMDGRSHGKLLPRYAGPIAAFLLRHPQARQAELIAFVAQTFGEDVSRIALYKFLKKYGLHRLAKSAEPPGPAAAIGELVSDPPLESSAATAQPEDDATAPPVASRTAPLGASTPVLPCAIPPVPLGAATLIATPTPVIELARAIAPSQPSAPPFSSDARTTPAPSCCWGKLSTGWTSPACASATRAIR
jgi:hypothetical protein